MKLLAWLVAIALLLAVGVAAQAQTGDLDVVQLRPNFYVIVGAGGNVVVQIGAEGVILVDSGCDRDGGQGARGSPPTDAVCPSATSSTPAWKPTMWVGTRSSRKAGLSILAGAIAAGAGIGDDVVTNGGRRACSRTKTC